MPDLIKAVWNGEGEWQITLRVFRDLGIVLALLLLGGVMAYLAGFFIDALNKTYSGVVNEIVPSADPGSPSFLVKVSLTEGTCYFAISDCRTYRTGRYPLFDKK